MRKSHLDIVKYSNDEDIILRISPSDYDSGIRYDGCIRGPEYTKEPSASDHDNMPLERPSALQLLSSRDSLGTTSWMRDCLPRSYAIERNRENDEEED